MAVLAIASCFGFLSSAELWGKREQRAAAAAVDTIRNDHWLVAEIQGRPRLEKPPLPRWSIAGLMALTGRQDEWIVRLPGASAALAILGLVYLWGRRLGGRALGLTATSSLIAMPVYLLEMRQAGNDGLLALWTILALWAAWSRLHGDHSPSETESDMDQTTRPRGHRAWAWLFHGMLGLGMLTKGPIILLIVGLTWLPYLVAARRLRAGLGGLVDPWGILGFVAISLCWPIPVVLRDPEAVHVWLFEMTQKIDVADTANHRWRAPLAADWPGIVAPWIVVAGLGAVLPWLRRLRGNLGSTLWLVWAWTFANLAMFSLWKVAKTNYYVPCMPGVALLTGLVWLRLAESSGASTADRTVANRRALRVIDAHGVVLGLAGLVFLGAGVVQFGWLAPASGGSIATDWPSWASPLSSLSPMTLGTIGVVLGLSLLAAGLGMIVLVRRGAGHLALIPTAVATTLGLLIGFGVLATAYNPMRGHRELAQRLEEIVPPEVSTLSFFHELDEGLWFYLPGRQIVPIASSAPEYNDAYAMLARGEFITPELRLAQLEAYLESGPHVSDYLLIRTKIYDLFTERLNVHLTPIYREPERDRNALVLLRLKDRETRESPELTDVEPEMGRSTDSSVEDRMANRAPVESSVR